MRTFYRLGGRAIWVALLLCVAGGGRARAQVLAQRDWAGSGVSLEPWWQRAVFYRIDPERFQDSNGDGRGDLQGVVQRLGYLRGLGVDALIVQVGSGAKDGTLMEGFDDLARAAVDSHVRVLAEMDAPASQGADAQYLGAARAWLNQGAAGLFVPTAALERVDGTGHLAELLRQLRALTDSFPGGRVLLAGAPAAQDQELLQALARYAQLTAGAPFTAQPSGAATAATTPSSAATAAAVAATSPPAAVTTTSPAATAAAAATTAAGIATATAANTPSPAAAAVAASLRVQLMMAEGVGGAEKERPLLQAERPGAMPNAAEEQGIERALAVMLLASRGAVLLEYGQELGLETAAGGGEPLMQWTPTNLTRKVVPRQPVAAAGPAPQGESLAFHAYIPPLRKDLFPPPAMPDVTESDEPVAAAVDPATLPGFTAGSLDAGMAEGMAAGNGATANVATEQADAGSLLHLYEQLMELRHENATLRNGAQTVLNDDAQGTVAWVRRAPAKARSSPSVVVGCNLTGRPVALEDGDGVGTRGMRSLLSPGMRGDVAVMAGEGWEPRRAPR